MEEVRTRLRLAGKSDFLRGVAVLFPSPSPNTDPPLLISLDRLEGGLRSSGESNDSLNALNELVYPSSSSESFIFLNSSDSEVNSSSDPGIGRANASSNILSISSLVSS